jgi:hypothetical protein
MTRRVEGSLQAKMALRVSGLGRLKLFVNQLRKKTQPKTSASS